MKSKSAFRCDACGASQVTKNSLTGLLECQYCGSSLVHESVDETKTPVLKQAALLVMLPVIVIALVVIYWAFITEERSKHLIQPTATSLPQTQVQTQEYKPAVVKPKEAVSSQVLAERLTLTSEVHGQTSQKALFWIFGLKNHSVEAVHRPGVTVSLFDAKGQRLAEQSGWSAQTLLAPGESSEVLVLISTPPKGIAKTEINTLASVPNDFTQEPVALEVSAFRVNEKRGQFELVGDIENKHSGMVKFSRVFAVARNASGQPIGMGNSYATQKHLNPNETSGFKISVGTFLKGDPDHWTLWAHGRLQ